jgi:hypothetical protein
LKIILKSESKKIVNMKKIYEIPQIKLIKLDNEISLVLSSDPPIGPGETMNQVPEYFNNNPYPTPLG